MMFGIRNISRRTFLKSVGVTGAFVLGANVASRIPTARGQSDGNSVKPNLFVEIADDGTVTLTCNRSEMGQGVRTGIPMILADELEADWQRVRIRQAPGDETRFDPAGKDQQNTDGSRSIRHHFEVMRELGAAGRYVLEQAAARKWSVDPREVYARNHRLHHSGTGRSFDFGEVVDAAADIAVPAGDAAPKLKDKSQWKYIGRDMPVVDNYDMSTGRATYGADVSVPGMKIAVVARPPVYRGKVKLFDAGEALKVQGVEQVIEIPALADAMPAQFRALGGIAVIGTNTWSVMEGRDRLVIEWEDGPNVKHDSGAYNDELRSAARAGGHVIRDRGNVDEALGSAARVIEAEYFVPYLIHTPMEPPVALADATRRPVRIVTSTQAPNETRQYVAEALGIKKTEVECEVTLLGGGFGRKSKPDFACEAAILSARIGAPVRVQWTRVDEIRHGYYHAASAHRLRAGLDGSGKVTAWHHSGAWPSLISLWNPVQRTGHAVEFGFGLVDTPYDRVPNLRIENGEVGAMIRIGWFRSVNNIQHAFAMNCFANELAEAAGRDPVEFLLELIGDADVMDLARDGVEGHWNYGDSIEDWPIMPKRLSNVLRVVAEKSGYGKSMPAGHGLGIACHRSFHSYVGTAVHVVVRDDGWLHVPRVDMAIDCGRYVNPEGVKKQMEGAAVDGHSLAMHGQITTTRGAVDQSNFHDYTIARMDDAPLDVRTHIVEDFTHLRPCGVGEPGVPPYAPALVNAIYQATGKRLRSLPIGDQLESA